MLGYDQDAGQNYRGRAKLWNALSIASLLALLVLMLTHGRLVESVLSEYPTLSALAAWAGGMLSYHQDAKRHGLGWAICSQILAIVGLVALLAFGFKYKTWPNFLIAPPLAWLQIQFTRRWWAKPGRWW